MNLIVTGSQRELAPLWSWIERGGIEALGCEWHQLRSVCHFSK